MTERDENINENIKQDGERMTERDENIGLPPEQDEPIPQDDECITGEFQGNGFSDGHDDIESWIADHATEMTEHGWYRAVGADEKAIRIGDEFKLHGFVHAVSSIAFYESGALVGWTDDHSCGIKSANKIRHYHKPTVEDMLRELIDKVLMLSEPGSEEELVAEYATRLQLAGDDAE